MFVLLLLVASPAALPPLDRDEVAIIRAAVAQEDREMLDFYREDGGVCVARETTPWSEYETKQLQTLRESALQPADAENWAPGLAEALREAAPDATTVQAARSMSPDLLAAGDRSTKRHCTITLNVSTPRRIGRFAVASTHYRGNCWCGHGGVYIMERRTDGWKVIDTLYRWIA